jgi:hypothetical protein
MTEEKLLALIAALPDEEPTTPPGDPLASVMDILEPRSRGKKYDEKAKPRMTRSERIGAPSPGKYDAHRPQAGAGKGARAAPPARVRIALYLYDRGPRRVYLISQDTGIPRYLVERYTKHWWFRHAKCGPEGNGREVRLSHYGEAAASAEAVRKGGSKV